jgi:hypothetical protein
MACNELDFSRISCEATHDMCLAVRQLGIWDFVREFEDEQHGFMFSNDPRVAQIGNHPLVDRHGHSGASFGICCRNVQFIAKNGLNAWCARFENKNK